MPTAGKNKVSKKREKQVQYFKNVDKYKTDHGKSPSWGPKTKKGK